MVRVHGDSLVDRGDGSLYGTTGTGGLYGRGTLFKLSPEGDITVLHSFVGPPSDGAFPKDLAKSYDGTLYGVTYYGGQHDYGTVFKFTSDGVFSVLHDFGESFPEKGYFPTSILVATDGNLYGMAQGSAAVKGGVFRLTPDGITPFLHEFGTERPRVLFLPGRNLSQGPDGYLYGATAGGATIFRLSLDGAFEIVFEFGSNFPPPLHVIQSSDGDLYRVTHRLVRPATVRCFVSHQPVASRFSTNSPAVRMDPIPEGGLIQTADGSIYGTTTGVNFSGGLKGPSTIFRLDPRGRFESLHVFASTSEGDDPQGPLTLGPGGSLYGSTLTGGSFDRSTIFKISSAVLVDPVPDLMSAAAIGTDAGVLATKGRVVHAVAADGVTELVLRIPSISVGDQFTVTVVDDTGHPSQSTDEDGGLGARGDAGVSEHEITVSAEANK